LLRQRVITALIAAPLVLGAIFFAPPIVYAAFFLVLATVAAFEWFRLADASGPSWNAFAWLLFVVTLLLFTIGEGFGVAPVLLIGVCIWWVWHAASTVLRYPTPRGWFDRPMWHAANGALVLASAWYALVAIRNTTGGAWLVMWMFAIVWAADIGAYFAGRRFGRRKLAPDVSPGKTWEGAWGGLVAAAVVGAALGAAVPLLAQRYPWFVWGLVALPLAAVSIVGDLFESVLKRIRGVKDSGAFFPGHGGALDRIDSVIAVAPFFALFTTTARMLSA
jgi:phosphatidate cytidylyltransferase